MLKRNATSTFVTGMRYKGRFASVVAFHQKFHFFRKRKTGDNIHNGEHMVFPTMRPFCVCLCVCVRAHVCIVNVWLIT